MPRYPRRPPRPLDPPLDPLQQRVAALRERNGTRLPVWGMMPMARSGYRSMPIRQRSEEDRRG